MDLTEDQLRLVTAARIRRPGALRELALSFDGQLAAEDASLDGAVAAWQVVRVPRTRLGTMWVAAWARVRGRRRADPPGVPPSAGPCHEHAEAALYRRPAA